MRWLRKMDVEKEDKLEILSSSIQAARSVLEALQLMASSALGEIPEEPGLRARLEEKLTTLLFEFIDLTEARFHVAV